MIDEADLLPEDQEQFADIYELYEPELTGRTDPVFEQIVLQSLDKLPFSLKGNIPVEIVDDDVFFADRQHMVTALYDHGRQVIQIFSYACRKVGDANDLNLLEWIPRLLAHEYGHAKGLTDAQMKERFGY